MLANAATLLTFAAAAGSALAAPAPAHSIQKRCSGGQATYFAVGLGNCGWTNKGSDFIVALPTSTYAGGSMCGQTITITNNENGKSTQATVADSCPTCGNSCDLDMSEGLFSYLNNGNMGAGVFSITWNQGGSSSNNNNNQNNQPKTTSSSQQQQQQQQPTSSKSEPKASSTSSSSAASTTTAKVAPYSQPLANVSSVAPTGQPNSTVTSEPSWWAEIDTAYCNIKAPEANVSIAAVGPTQWYNGTNLSDACGKWVQIHNPANKKNVTALVGMWIPDMPTNFLALTDGYKKIADMQGNFPNPVTNVTWGFVEKNATTKAN